MPHIINDNVISTTIITDIRTINASGTQIGAVTANQLIEMAPTAFNPIAIKVMTYNPIA